MGGWKLESFKMLGYLTFPIGAFILFNNKEFYEKALKQTMELVSRDVNFENIARFERIAAKGEIDKLGDVIEELDDFKPVAAAAIPNTASEKFLAAKPSNDTIVERMQRLR